MAALVQSQTNTGSASTSTITLPSNITAGNTVLVAYTGGTFPSTPTDSLGNTYHLAAGGFFSSYGEYLDLFYAYNVTAGACTISITSSSSWSLIALEYSGLITTNPLDKTHTGQGSSGSTIDSGATTTTTQANELVVGIGGSVQNRTFTAGSGFGDLLSVRGSLSLASEDMNISATGTQDATFTVNGSTQWAAIVATFMAAATSSPINFIASPTVMVIR